MKRPATLLIGGAALALSLIILRNCAVNSHGEFIEALYLQAQEESRAEFARRQANVARLETAQRRTAQVYLAEIDILAADADKKIAMAKWRSNQELKKANASKDEILDEKSKVETALKDMTANRDELLCKAEAREEEVKAERLQLKTEHDAALAAKQRELDTCEKARQAALGKSGRRTWLSIGPSSQISLQDGTVKHRLGISIQIPIIEIKSPFKRF